MAEPGRPSTYTEEAFEEVCRFIENGHSIERSVSGVDGCGSVSAFLRWVQLTPSNTERYAQARAIRADLMADELLQIADDGTNDTQIDKETGVPIVNYDHIQRSKLRIDARKFLMAKMNPRTYGDRLSLDHSGKVETGIDLANVPTEVLNELLKHTKQEGEE